MRPVQGRQGGLRPCAASVHPLPEPIAAGRVRLPRLAVQKDEARPGEDDYSGHARTDEVWVRQDPLR